MSDILEKILSTKREEIMQRKQKLSLSDQKRLGESQEEPRDFVNALKSAAINSRAGVIAEIKKASPSQGIIRENFDPYHFYIFMRCILGKRTHFLFSLLIPTKYGD